jgi:hypothetical protein
MLFSYTDILFRQLLSSGGAQAELSGARVISGCGQIREMIGPEAAYRPSPKASTKWTQSDVVNNGTICSQITRQPFPSFMTPDCAARRSGEQGKLYLPQYLKRLSDK